MAARKETGDEGEVSALPEKFEIFERTMKTAHALDMPAKAVERVTGTIADVFAPIEERPTRRRSAPASTPNAFPKPQAVAATVERSVMIEKMWGGRTMWECPACRDTTFDRRVVNIHVCKKTRFA
jgi:hypothetical protein